MEAIRSFIEMAALGIESLAVGDAYEEYKVRLGKALLLGRSCWPAEGEGHRKQEGGQLPPDKLQAFKAMATTGRGEGALEGTAQIHGVNVLQQGDSMTIWIDPASQMMRRIEIKTIYDKKPASAMAKYQSVPNGPTYMAHAVLAYQEKSLELTVDNSDYQRAQS